ncbi:MAG TPA: 16S rRNA (uracil(1498)-N(3))-methyltransferase [Rhodanobacteraceae bacterium]|nr:16S rRNA (uracil(1498)-N(3))-methyltransferase [Rhodanobacteraceae bacterium]
MRMTRLFVEAPLRPDCEVELPAGAAAHAVRVLRLRPGDPVTLFNGDGHEYTARLVTATPRGARAAIGSMAAPARESPLQVTLLQAIARGEKMDWIIQKATELGVARITPVSTGRSEVRLDAARAEKRREHWQAVAIAACEQCGRNAVPAIDPPMELEDWLGAPDVQDQGRRWMLNPDGGTRLRDLQLAPGALALAIGPEGGFDEADLGTLAALGFRGLALGPRVLRTETAGIAALAALQALYGDG